MWGISSGGIWLTQPDDRERAKALLADYQQERARRQREAYEEAQREGTAPTLAGRLREQPLRVAGLFVVVLVLLLVTLLPFLTLG
jgi:hypothetical protein